MQPIAGFVDCVSLPCPSVLASTVQKLGEVNPGSNIEVICEERQSAGQLMLEVVKLGHKVIEVNYDLLGNIRVVIEKIY